MRDPHEPHHDFVDRLQWQLRSEIRQRQRLAAVDRAPVRSGWRMATAALALAIVSMGVGGGIVVAAGRVQSNQQRELLAARYQRQLELEKERLAISQRKLDEGDRRVRLGLAKPDELVDDRRVVTDIGAQIAVLELNVAEVRASGQEPAEGITAPLISGRDFVSERLRIELNAVKAAREFENTRLREATRLVGVGLVPKSAVVAARSRVDELDTAAAGFESRLELRQRFLKKEIVAAEAELRLVEIDALARQRALGSKLVAARDEFESARRMFSVGIITELTLAKAQLRVNEIETDLAKASVDLAMIQAKIAERRGK